MSRSPSLGSRLLLLVAALLMAACADLSAVRDFASLWASITGSIEMSARWWDVERRLGAISGASDLPLAVGANQREPIHRATEIGLTGALAATAAAIATGQPAAGTGALASLQPTLASVKGA